MRTGPARCVKRLDSMALTQLDAFTGYSVCRQQLMPSSLRRWLSDKNVTLSHKPHPVPQVVPLVPRFGRPAGAQKAHEQPASPKR
jgi:hypothetical protein